MTGAGQLAGRILDFDHIPIERHWGLSMRLHDALGHTGPWEICEAGCDGLASDAIRILFGDPTPAAPPKPPVGATDELTPRGRA